MKLPFWLEQIPLGGVFFVTAAIVLLSIWVGTFLGHRKRLKPDHGAEASLNPIITATLGLLAFMLVFTFGIAAQSFQARRQLLLDEVNAIGTTYLRAGLLPEPQQGQIRKLLCEYVDIRVNLAKENARGQAIDFEKLISHAEALQDQMWSHAAAAALAERNSMTNALFITALNQMIDLQTSRLTVLTYRIPPVIWYSLYFITILATATVGYQIGLSGKKASKVGIVLALTFSAVVFLVADLDRSTEGNLRVNQKPMFELQQKLHTSIQEASQK
jgi:hypothetical protein